MVKLMESFIDGCIVKVPATKATRQTQVGTANCAFNEDESILYRK